MLWLYRWRSWAKGSGDDLSGRTRRRVESQRLAGMPAGRGRFLCPESASSLSRLSLTPLQPSLDASLVDATLPSQLDPSAFWAFASHLLHQNAVLLKVLKFHYFVQEKKTILSARSVHSMFILRCRNTDSKDCSSDLFHLRHLFPC